jgi:5-methylcytosine-specific restriction endonuclease McrA
MPTSTAKLCRDCSRRATTGDYCDQHQTVNRARDYQRLYDRYRINDPMRHLYQVKRWKAVRLIVLIRDPLCCVCGHKASTIADHVVKARDIVAEHGIEAFYDADRCQGLCASCHAIKTATVDSTFAHKRTAGDEHDGRNL